jgi:hypothetical protein
MRALLIVALLTSTAVAGGPSKKQIEDALRTYDEADATPRFGIDSLGVHGNEKKWQDTNKDVLELVKLEEVAITPSADGGAAWATFRLRRAMQCAGLGGKLEKCEDKKQWPPVNILLLVERDEKRWVPVASHSGAPISDGDVNAKLVAGMKLAAVPKQTSEAASSALALFSATIGVPAKLAASTSSNATLIGSNNEKLSGTKVAASLKKWNLAFTAQGDIATGATKSGTVAWVAANVRAASLDPKAKPAKAEYRMMCLYEKQNGAWRMVAITFSFPFQPPDETLPP